MKNKYGIEEKDIILDLKKLNDLCDLASNTISILDTAVQNSMMIHSEISKLIEKLEKFGDNDDK